MWNAALLCGHRHSPYRLQRHASLDCGASRVLRVDDKVSLHELKPFLHADEAQPAPFPGSRIEADARIANSQGNCVRQMAKFNFETMHSAMLYAVVKRFLQNPEEAQRDLGVYRRDVIARKRNLDLFLLRQLRAETSRGFHDAEMPQCGRVQFMRQAMNASGDTRDLLAEFSDSSGDIRFRVQGSKPQILESNGHEGKLLADIVVQVTRDPGPFSFLCLDQPASQRRKWLPPRPFAL